MLRTHSRPPVTLKVKASAVIPHVAVQARHLAAIVEPTLRRIPNTVSIGAGIEGGETVFSLTVLPIDGEDIPTEADWIEVIRECPPPSIWVPSAARTHDSSASSKSP